MKKELILFTLPLFTLLSCSSKKSDVTPIQSNSGVSTYVGDGTAGLKNGTGLGAELNIPADMVIDVAGNVYVSEQGNNVIRRIAPGGVVTTYAGDGTPGFKNGAGTTAEFNRPEGLVLDATGNLYVADAGNNMIRKITPDGTVSTYAGNGTSGLVNGTAATAEFDTPTGLAIDKQKNIYVTDYASNVVRKITSNGTVSTLAGSGTAGSANGTAAAASFNHPSGIAIDVSDDLYVADAGNNAIREITPSGDVSTVTSSLIDPVRIAISAGGDIFVANGNSTIQKLSNSGQASIYAGNGSPGFADGSLLSAEFNSPLGLIADSQGNLLVADSQNNRIRLIIQ